LTFTVGDTSATAPITASGDLILLAKPSVLGGNGGVVTLTLLNGNGTPVPGVQLTGTCENAGLASGPGVTNSAGQTTANISANLNQPNNPGTGSCTFTTATGSPTAKVTLKGIDPCTLGISPPPAGCSSGGNFNLALQLNSAGTGYGSVTSTPAGMTGCTMSSPTSVGCSGSFASGTVVTLTAVLGATSTGVTWGGSCTAAGNALSATVTLSANTSCTVEFDP
jgi:hypothetical protein